MLIYLLIFFNKWNDTLKQKLTLPASGGKCLYESVIRFIQEQCWARYFKKVISYSY